MNQRRVQRLPPVRLPTGSDVARLAGVSKSAVSRAYTGGIVSDEARARILDAAHTLKYRPNGAARSLTTNRSRLIGVAITHLDNQFYPEVIERISERLSTSGYRMVLFITRGETDLEPVTEEILGLRLDGVILASSSMAAHVATECQALGVPVIMFNNVDPTGRVPGVTTDNDDGARALASHLLDGGHRNFGIVTGVADSSTSSEREAAFRASVQNAACIAPAIEAGLYEFDEAARATARLLDRHPRTDAIFCVNDHMAFAALQTVRLRGLVPGRDISIVGFDGVTIGGWPEFDLTTFAQPVAEMTDYVVDELIGALGGCLSPIRTMRLRGRIVPRGSSRAKNA